MTCQPLYGFNHESTPNPSFSHRTGHVWSCVSTGEGLHRAGYKSTDDCSGKSNLTGGESPPVLQARGLWEGFWMQWSVCYLVVNPSRKQITNTEWANLTGSSYKVTRDRKTERKKKKKKVENITQHITIKAWSSTEPSSLNRTSALTEVVRGSQTSEASIKGRNQ